MLENIKLNDRSFQDIVDRAIGLIPLVSNEWTDYNDSDPGITILQMLAVLSFAQQSYVDEVNNKVKENLIKLLGYIREPAVAPVAISAMVTKKDQTILKNTKFLCGDGLVFEPREDCFAANNAIKQVVLVGAAGADDITDVVAKGIIGSFAKIFTEEAEELYVAFEKNLKPGNFVSLYFDLVDGDKNEVFFGFNVNLCSIAWECFSDGRWRELLVDDGTFAFGKSGFVRFKLNNLLSEFEATGLSKGFYIRARFKKGHFNVVPKLDRVLFNAVSLFGQDTKARAVVFVSDGKDKQSFALTSRIVGCEQLLVICNEGDQGLQYSEWSDSVGEQRGRFYTYDTTVAGSIILAFDRARFGFAPALGERIKVVVYSDDAITAGNLGRVVGFDEQKIGIDLKCLAESSLELMLKTVDIQGRTIFAPCCRESERVDDSDLAYRLDYENQMIVLNNKTSCSGELIVTSYALCCGKGGNIKAGMRFALDASAKKRFGDVEAYNLFAVTNGRERENIDDLTKRAVLAMEATGVAVTKEDYLALLKNIPGLEIEKVNIIFKPEHNKVTVVVKPKSEKAMPEINQWQAEILERQMEEHRQVTTNICFISPSYVPVNVAGHIYIKPGFKDARSKIHDTLEFELDGINSAGGFGCGVIYGDVYSKIEKLPCVEYIESLSFDSDSVYAQKDDNGNLILKDFALGYLGNFFVHTDNKAG
ncbi:MAG: baseplate J/gp47 family protein [Oscillospiraceae bacterium]|jgi:hypothetical protein|nr:baseplate J/gp47 family protein [Oscillospiraceae bacterium]